MLWKLVKLSECGYLFVVNVEYLSLRDERCEHYHNGWVAASILIIAVPAVIDGPLTWPFVVELQIVDIARAF